MFASLKSLVGTLLMPLPVALLLVLIGVWLAGRGFRRTGVVLVFSGFLLLCLSVLNPVANRLLEPLELAYPPVAEPGGLEDVAAVVVLGGGWEPDADWPAAVRLSKSSVHRLMEGLRLLQRLPEARLVASGGSRCAGERPVAEGYAEAAQDLGLPAVRILVLDTPTDTAQVAYAVRDLLGTESRFVLVTSASHMPRAMRHFQRVGLRPIPAPTQFLTGRDDPDRLGYWVPSSAALEKTERALDEYLGLLALGFDHPD